jgi:hypothetical protein
VAVTQETLDRYKGLNVPLLLWYKAEEDVVIGLLQEYAHVRFPEVPPVRIWHWSLLSNSVNLQNVACNFEESGIMVSLKLLVKFAAVYKKTPRIEWGRIRNLAQMKEDQFVTESSPGLSRLSPFHTGE